MDFCPELPPQISAPTTHRHSESCGTREGLQAQPGWCRGLREVDRKVGRKMGRKVGRKDERQTGRQESERADKKVEDEGGRKAEL